MDNWFEDFYGGLYEMILADRFGEAQSLHEARTVKRLLRLRKGARVLDIPCGMGRLAIPLARMGLAVTGIDFAANYLRRARRHAKESAVSVHFVRGDMREINYDASFGGVFNWFGSFGYFSDKENFAFLEKILRALKPGARFLVEGLNKSWFLAHLPDRLEKTVGKVRLRMHKRFDSESSRDRSYWTFSEGGHVERNHLNLRIFTGTEIRVWFHRAGFREIELYAWPSLKRLTHHSPRFIIVGRRPR